jgi:hypothetical protein
VYDTRPAHWIKRFNCQWTDAMGYEQAAYAKPEGWVGGECSSRV